MEELNEFIKQREVVILLMLVALLYLSVVGFIAADLWSGVRKARQADIPLTSSEYKRTLDKASTYFNVMIVLSLFDVIQLALIVALRQYDHNLPLIPWFSAIGTAYVGFVEVKSIFEPANEKERRVQQDFAKAIVKVVKNAHDPKKALTELLTELAKENDNEKTEE